MWLVSNSVNVFTSILLRTGHLKLPSYTPVLHKLKNLAQTPESIDNLYAILIVWPLDSPVVKLLELKVWLLASLGVFADVVWNCSSIHTCTCICLYWRKRSRFIKTQNFRKSECMSRKKDATCESFQFNADLCNVSEKLN